MQIASSRNPPKRFRSTSVLPEARRRNPAPSGAGGCQSGTSSACVAARQAGCDRHSQDGAPGAAARKPWRAGPPIDHRASGGARSTISTTTKVRSRSKCFESEPVLIRERAASPPAFDAAVCRNDQQRSQAPRSSSAFGQSRWSKTRAHPPDSLLGWRHIERPESSELRQRMDHET